MDTQDLLKIAESTVAATDNLHKSVNVLSSTVANHAERLARLESNQASYQDGLDKMRNNQAKILSRVEIVESKTRRQKLDGRGCAVEFRKWLAAQPIGREFTVADVRKESEFFRDRYARTLSAHINYEVHHGKNVQKVNSIQHPVFPHHTLNIYSKVI